MPPRKRTTATSTGRSRTPVSQTAESVDDSRPNTRARSRSRSVSVVSDEPSEASHASRASRASHTPARKPRTPRAATRAARSSAPEDKTEAKAKTPRSTRSARTSRRTRTPAKRSATPETDREATPTPREAQAPLAERLPAERNPILPPGPVPAKLQVIQREVVSPSGNIELKEIVIGRVKLPTVNGPTHGFLLKRFDTNALAASSMFKIAFPYATPEAEAAEMDRLLSTYECHTANGGQVEEQGEEGPRQVLPPGSSGVMLQGVWVPSANAQAVAEDYGLATYTAALVESRAAVIDGKPYFLDSDGRPFAAASGAKLDSKERNFLWTNLETEREARELKARTTDDEPVVEVEVTEEEEIIEPAGKRSRPAHLGGEGHDEEHVLVADVDTALQAAREEAQAIQAAGAKANSNPKAQAKRRAQDSGEDEAEVSKAEPRKPLTRAQKETQRVKQAAAARIAAKQGKTPASGSQVAIAPPRRIAGTARVRALMRQHPVASVAAVGGVSVAATAAATAAAAATGLIPPEQWASAIAAVQAGVASLQHWFA